MPNTAIRFDSGEDPARATVLAHHFDVVIVFAVQYSREDRDLVNVSLPDPENDLIAVVARANQHTIVVPETCDPVTMRWIDQATRTLADWRLA